jgi:hypothetical protein
VRPAVQTVALHPAPVRGTQSFVHTLSSCWRRPSLASLEILWRWTIGIPALLLLYAQGVKLLSAHPLDTLALGRMSLLDPEGAALILQQSFAPLIPPAEHLALWLAPVLTLAWIAGSSLGRTAVLGRADPTLHRRPLSLALLHTLRLVALTVIVGGWYLAIQADAQFTVKAPIARGQEPSVVLYSALVIIATLTFFTAWAVVSWIFSAAPLLAMRRDLSAGQSIAAGFRLGPLKSKLIEINLVMGIVKIALMVLALVLSACPLPFESVATPEFMLRWYIITTVLYLIASDFFHVVHLVAYLDLWNTFEPAPSA